MSGRGGVRVGRVEMGGAAHAAGLRTGDRVVRLGTAPVSEVADLWRPAGPERLLAHVERGPVDQPRTIALPRSADAARLAPPAWDVAFAAVALLAVLVILWPASVRARAGNQGGHGGQRASAGAVAIGLTVAGLGSAAMWSPDALHVVRGWVVAVLAVFAVVLRFREAHASPMARVLLVAARVSTASVALTAAALLSGTMLPALASGVSLEVYSWLLFSTVPGVLCVWLGAATLATSSPEPRLRAAFKGLRWVGCLGLVALLAEAGGGPYWMVAAPPSVLFFGKTVLLFILASAATTVGGGRRSQGAVTLGAVTALAPLSVVAWSWWDPSAGFTSTLGVVMMAGLGLLSLRAIVLRVRRRRDPEPVIDPSLVTFL